MKIETTRLLIREWNVTDAKAFLPLSQDPALNQAPQPKLAQTSMDDCERKLIEWALQFGQTKMGLLPIFLKDKNILIGVGGIKPLMLDPKNLHFEVICRIGSQYWKNGYASEIIPELMKYGFKTLGLNEVVGVGQSEFPASQRVFEKSGMSYLKSALLQNKKIDIYSVAAQ